MSEIRVVAVFVFNYHRGKYNFYLVQRGSKIPSYPSTWTTIGSTISSEDVALFEKIQKKHGDIVENMLEKTVALRQLLERNLIFEEKMEEFIPSETDFRQKLLEMDPSYLNVLLHSMVPCGSKRVLVDNNIMIAQYFLFITPSPNSFNISQLSNYSEYITREDQILETKRDWLNPSKLFDKYYKLKELFSPAVTSLISRFYEDKKKLIDVAREIDSEKSQLALEGNGYLPFIWRFQTHAHTQVPFNITNIYVVGNQKRYILDPGSARKESIKLLIEYVEKNLDKMEGILLTNSFVDHCNQALFFKENYDLPLYASRKIADNLEDEGFVFNSILEDGTKIDLGSYEPLNLKKWELETISLSGYEDGQIGFWDQRGVLFASSLFHQDMISAIGSYKGAYTDLMQSFNRISKLKAKYVLTGHRDIIVDYKSSITYNLKQFSKNEPLIIEQLKSGNTSRDSIMESVQSNAKYEWECLARSVTDVVLAKLSEEDKVSKRGEDYFWLKNTIGDS
ncbi:MAG: MBL fold metallo-hydrolase [Candidatus Heimdallarchaeaceae archaeon]